jgi:hypothetical protein
LNKGLQPLVPIKIWVCYFLKDTKIVKSNHLKDFDEMFHKPLTAEFGFYTDLLSIKSEDAITWSLFGYISYMEQNVIDSFYNEFLSKLDFQKDSNCIIKLWQRLPHPQTFVSGGPEVDVILMGNKYCILIECKWSSGIGKNQGVDKNLDQIQIRNMWKDGIGKRIYPNHNIVVVFVANHKHPDIKSITWEELSTFDSLPHKDDFRQYLIKRKTYLSS